ncbi:Ig-like domain-containing protein [Paenibacillus sp. FSL R7-0216]|uniref:Ig-like domain-containing protein n=1 Tax=Paenibacillus sp. FSL R7-0216 TaxID=2921677 RepID=UPI0030D8E759
MKLLFVKCFRVLPIFLTLLLLLCSLPVFAETYQYDEANRLTRLIYDDQNQIQYTYDKSGNRITAKLIGNGNKLRNPGFERYSGSSEVAESWSVRVDDGVHATFEGANQPVKSGLYSQKLNVSGLINEKAAAISQEISLTPSHKYEFMGYLHVDSIVNAHASINIEFYDQNNIFISSKEIEQTSTTETFIALDDHGFVPANAHKGVIYIAIKGTGQDGAGTIYVDDLLFKTSAAQLQVVETNPMDSEQDVDPQLPLSIKFNKIVKAERLSRAIELKRGEEIIKATLQIEQQVLMIIPTVPLPGGSTFTLFIPKGAFSAEGELLPNNVNLIFTTRDTTNLLRNGGFEQYTMGEGVGDSWSTRWSEGVQADFEIVDTPVQSGSKAQKISVSRLAEGQTAGLYQAMAVGANKSYELQGYLRIDELSGATVVFYVDFYDEAGEYINGMFLEQSAVTNEYVNLRGEGVVPANAVQAAVYVAVGGTGDDGTGTVYMDNLFFKTSDTQLEVSGATPTEGEQEVDPQQPITVTFNKPVIAGTEYSAITLKRGEELIETTMQMEQQVLTVTPTISLAEGSTFILTIPKDAVQDSEGNGLSSAVTLSFSTRQDDANLLRNGGFEQYTGNEGVGDFWSTRWSEGVQANFEIVNDPVQFGTNAQKISVTGLSEGMTAALYQSLPVGANENYELQGFLRVDELTEAIVIFYVDFYDEAGEYITGKFLEQETVTDGYVYLQGVGTVPADARSAAVYVMVEGTGETGTGTVYVDDLFFKTSTAQLQMLGTNPTEGEQEVDPQQPITVTFNKPVTAGTEYSAITLKRGEEIVETTMQIEQQVLTVAPTISLNEGSMFVLTIPKDSVQDSEGNGLSNAVTLTFSTRQNSANLLRNGGFEQYTGGDGVGDSWSAQWSEGARADFEIVDTPVQSGTKAQKISVAGLAEGQTAGLYQTLAVGANKSYELQGYLRIDELSGTTVVFYVDFYDEAGEYIAGKFLEQPSVTNDYIQLNEVGIVPENAVSAAVYIMVSGIAMDGNARLYVDDILFKTNESTLSITQKYLTINH